MFGFVGPNGAGKTTAMRIVIGVLAAGQRDGRVEGRADGCRHSRPHRLHAGGAGPLPEDARRATSWRISPSSTARTRPTPRSRPTRWTRAARDRRARRDDRVEDLSLGKPAAGPARRRARSRARAPDPRRAVLRPRPDRRGRPQRGAGRRRRASARSPSSSPRISSSWSSASATQSRSSRTAGWSLRARSRRFAASARAIAGAWSWTAIRRGRPTLPGVSAARRPPLRARWRSRSRKSLLDEGAQQGAVCSSRRTTRLSPSSSETWSARNRDGPPRRSS